MIYNKQIITDNFIRLLTTFSNLEELYLSNINCDTNNNQIELILTKLTKLTKLEIYEHNDTYEVFSLPHSNLVELTVKICLSSDEMISIASSKKKGFTLTCSAKYEDVVKAIHSCPSTFFISNNSRLSVITLEDALDAIYGPMKTSFVKSEDQFERVYNKKGYRLVLRIDNSPDFKLTLD